MILSLVMGISSLGQMVSTFTVLISARAAMDRIVAILDRIPNIDTSSPREATGVTNLHIRRIRSAGRIEFKNVTFSYPSRPNVPVLKNFSLIIEAGEHVAIVGPSGLVTHCSCSMLLKPQN